MLTVRISHLLYHSILGQSDIQSFLSICYLSLEMFNLSPRRGYDGRHFWLDGSDAQAEGSWVTSSGDPVPRGTPFWAAFQDFQEPNNSEGNEHCLEIGAPEYYYMNDVPCSKENNFICQYKNQKQEGEVTYLYNSFVSDR